MKKNLLYYQRRGLVLMALVVDILLTIAGIAFVWAVFKGLMCTPMRWFEASVILSGALAFDYLWDKEAKRLYRK